MTRVRNELGRRKGRRKHGLTFARRYHLWLSHVAVLAFFMMGTMQFFLLCYGLAPQPRRRVIERRRQAWEEFIRPIIKDGSFRLRYRMSRFEFAELYGMLRSRLEGDTATGKGRNGTVEGEWALAGTLRWLAGGSIYEAMDGPHVARSTAYAMIGDTLAAIIDCNRLRIKFPRKREDLQACAAGFKARSSHGIMKYCISAADGLLVRRRKPTTREHPAPNRFYSGHKKTVGMNLQAMCDADYAFTAVACNTPGSTNDRQAWSSANFDKLVESLPHPYFVVGDAAYGPTEKMLVPYPGTNLGSSQDAFNFFQSQSRMAIEQTFGIMVRTWGILWKPLEVPLNRTALVLHAVVRLHNFLRKKRSEPVKMAGQPPLNEDGTLKDDVWSTPSSRKPPATQSMLRENIRTAIAAQTLSRPDQNIRRNRSWRKPILLDEDFDVDEEGDADDLPN